MKARLFIASLLTVSSLAAVAQTPVSSVPLTVRSELSRRYPNAKQTRWDKNNGYYEAKWVSNAEGASTAVFTSHGAFVEVITPSPVKYLPSPITDYVKRHYHTAIVDANKSISVTGKTTYKVKIKGGKTITFDQNGKYLGH